MIDINQWVSGKKQEDLDFKRRMQEKIREIGILKNQADRVMMPSLKPCGSNKYNKWLHQFINNGGTPTHYYSYPSSQWTWYEANNDFTTTPLCGSLAFQIIAKEGINIDTSAGTGHINIYQFGKYDNTYVPVFSDSI